MEISKIKLNENIYYFRMDYLEDDYKGGMKEIKIGDRILTKKQVCVLWKKEGNINENYRGIFVNIRLFR